MSKPVKRLEDTSWGYGYVVHEGTHDRVSGRMFEIIEALGLPLKQEESVKNLVRKAVWDSFSDAIYIKPERHNEIRKAYYEARKNTGVPLGAI